MAIAYGELVTFGFTQNKATVISIALGILVYTVMLLVTGCLKKSDLKLLPGGERLAMFLTNLELLEVIFIVKTQIGRTHRYYGRPGEIPVVLDKAQTLKTLKPF